jgi:hypothetical protein
MADKEGPNVLFCMPNRTKCILFVPEMQASSSTFAIPGIEHSHGLFAIYVRHETAVRRTSEYSLSWRLHSQEKGKFNGWDWMIASDVLANRQAGSFMTEHAFPPHPQGQLHPTCAQQLDCSRASVLVQGVWPYT